MALLIMFSYFSQASANTQRIFLTAVSMGDRKGAHEIIKALRRKDIK